MINHSELDPSNVQKSPGTGSSPGSPIGPERAEQDGQTMSGLLGQRAHGNAPDKELDRKAPGQLPAPAKRPGGVTLPVRTGVRRGAKINKEEVRDPGLNSQDEGSGRETTVPPEQESSQRDSVPSVDNAATRGQRNGEKPDSEQIGTPSAPAVLDRDTDGLEPTHGGERESNGLGNKRQAVPRTAQLARTTFLALSWEEPLAGLTTEDGHALPGILEAALPEDREQTLGAFLTGTHRSADGAPVSETPTFEDFRNGLASGDKTLAKTVVGNFRAICPSPEEFFKNNTNLLNWVPWNTFIAFGETLEAQTGEGTSEKVSKIVSGDIYLSEARNKFPGGHPDKRTDIVLERQNKDARSQGVLEAVSNSIDAISEREKIGQFGLGVKQVFAWLEKGEGEVQVMTRTDGGEILSMRARKGYDDKIYVKFASPSDEDQRLFAEGQTGTIIKLTGITVDDTRQKDLTAKLHERFRYVPETTIAVNGTELNGHNQVKVVGREAAVMPQGKIDVTIDASEIVIRDTGSGMDQQSLFQMFLPGYGKGYRALSSEEAIKIAQTQAEVLLVDEEAPRIVFSRNREVVFAVTIPKDRLNTSTQTIDLELGNIIKVSEGRDNVEIDENFAVAIPIIVTRTLNDGSLTNSEKTAFLNSLLLGIDQLSGDVDQVTQDKMGAIVKKTKAGIRKATIPFIQGLQASDVILLPNYTQYQRLAAKAQFIDPYLLRGIGGIDKVLESGGLQLLRGQEGITTKDGWKVLAAPFKEEAEGQDLVSQVRNKDKLARVRANLADFLPIIIDKKNRIVIVDHAVWRAIDTQTDPIRRTYLQESIQAILNEKVLTSYEVSDPRVIAVRDAREKQDTTAEEGSFFQPEEEKKILRDTFLDNDLHWNKGNMLYSINGSGVMTRYDVTSKSVINRIAIPELEGNILYFAQPTAEGTWIVQHGGRVVLIDQEGNVKVNVHIPQLANVHGEFYMEDRLSISEDGRILICNWNHIEVIDPRGNETKTFTSVRGDTITSPFVTSDNKFIFMQKGRIVIDDMTTFHESDPVSNSINGMDLLLCDLDTKFFEFRGNTYVIAFDPGVAALIKINQDEEEITTTVIRYIELPPKFYLSELTLTIEPDTDTIGIQTGYGYSFLRGQELLSAQLQQFNFETHSTLSERISTAGYAAYALRELFGDENGTFYGNALFALIERLYEKQHCELVAPEERDSQKRSSTTDQRTLQFVALISSEQFRDVFHPLWAKITQDAPVEEQERLKKHFVRNAPLLLDLAEQTPSSEMLQLFFLSDNPQIFFDQNPEQLHYIASMLNDIDSLSQKEGFILLLTLATKGKTPEELDNFYNQVDKLFGKEQLRDRFLQIIVQNAAELPQALSDPSQLGISNPLRAYLLFITQKADLLRTKEQSISTDGYQDVLPHNMPLELMAYFRLTEGRFTLDEINRRLEQEGGIEAFLQRVDLSHYRDEIQKAIHAQSVEPGVAKRELLQNALYAIYAKGAETGNVTVDFYLRDEGREFVEEIRDDGTGIENIISFLVPGATSKDGSEGLGIFGTGFYKTLEDVDHVEVDTVSQGADTNLAKRIIIDLKRDKNGIVLGGWVRSVQMKKVLPDSETGTTIKLVRNTKDQLPELETMIAKNTYLTMGGLSVLPEVADSHFQLAYVNDKGEREPVTISVKDSSVVTVENIGDITFVKVPSLPSAMTSVGLRMSSLSQVSSDYLQDVPEVLKTFLTDEHISVVLPRTVPLVKDRSRIAHEEEYLPQIQQAIATEAIKRAAFALLNNTAVNVRGFIPEDILGNQSYYERFTSEAGAKAYNIAQKISSGTILDQEELNYLNQRGDNDNLILVLIGIEQTTQEGKKDSLLRRFQYIQEKSGNTTVSSLMSSVLDFDVTQTAFTRQLAFAEQHLVPKVKQRAEGDKQVAIVNNSLDQGKQHDGVISLVETDMDPQEKELLIDYFANIGFEEVYFLRQDLLPGAGGVLSGNRLFLSDILLSMDTRKRWEVINHETAHVFEKREVGITVGELDTKEDRESTFTHQQEGPFGQHHRLAARIMQNLLTQPQENASHILASVSDMRDLES